MSKCLRCGSDVKPHVVGGNSDRVRKREGVSEAMKRITDKMIVDEMVSGKLYVVKDKSWGRWFVYLGKNSEYSSYGKSLRRHIYKCFRKRDAAIRAGRRVK